MITLAGAAQDLKPVKDKQTRKYGYQAKDKSWVIEPRFDGASRFNDGFAEITLDGHKGLIDEQGEMILPAIYDDIKKFDKNGLCELMRKEGKTKLRGVADKAGRIIIPVDCHSVNVPKNGGVITAERVSDVESLEGMLLWGAYDMEGGELFAPQFLSAPSFSNGTGIAKSAVTGLTGAVSDAGEVLLPFEFLAVSRQGKGFRTLGTDFTQTNWDASLRRGESFHQPGAVIPYDPMDDPVRAAAWHSGPIGRRLPRNQVKQMEMRSARSGVCRELRLDWGYDRFLRLEPFVAGPEAETAMLDPVSGRNYTLKALLYEADGTLAEVVSSWGYLDSECNDGVIYIAEGQERWLVLNDPNAIASPSFTLSMSGNRQIDNADIYGGLGIHSADLDRLRDIRNFNDRRIAIIERDNLGVTSYLPPETSLQYTRKERDAARNPLFQFPFHMGDIVSCTVRSRKDGAEVELYENLACRFEDRFSDPSYSMSGEDLIWWGPNNARTARLSLKRVYRSSEATTDDVHGTGECYHLVLSLYEEDGTWLRTLAEAPYADYAQEGLLVFERLGIALLAPRNSRGYRPEYSHSNSWGNNYRGSYVRTVKMPGAEKLPRTISALEQAADSGFGLSEAVGWRHSR
ncbi:MAG: WG repeat-containing protein [Bacteroidales bacterium]|nr:WG repeat-containing protein [Bacteroidales bacterium]